MGRLNSAFFAVMTGLGLYEYMLLAEELGAEPVWVVNNGISHREDVPTSEIGPWVQVNKPGNASAMNGVCVKR